MPHTFWMGEEAPPLQVPLLVVEAQCTYLRADQARAEVDSRTGKSVSAVDSPSAWQGDAVCRHQLVDRAHACCRVMLQSTSRVQFRKRSRLCEKLSAR
jgi:hypothetical protein